MDLVVTRRIAENGEDRPRFVREILETDEGPKLSLEKIPKNLDFSRNAFKDKTKFREHSSDETKAEFAVPVIICVVEALSAQQWSKARAVPSCTHSFNRLLVAEHYRQNMVRVGVGHNQPQRWPAMTAGCHSGVQDPRYKIVSEELKFITKVENSPGPSLTDILTALTPLSARDIFNSERYEVLGDAFLKIAATHRFSQKDLSDEGTLTTNRFRLISDGNLLSLAVPKKLHEAVESCRFSINESFRPPGAIAADQEKAQGLQRQKYKSICADSIEAMIGVYLERSGPIGALQFLRHRGLPLGSKESGPFLSGFDLSYDPLLGASRVSREDTLIKYSFELNQMQSILGYKLNEPIHLLEAITHQSYQYNRATRSYEHLEFLGDGVIDYLVSYFIFTNNPNLRPGQITLVRSALVCNSQYAQNVTKTELAKHLLHHSPLLFRVAAGFTELLGRKQSSYPRSTETTLRLC